MLQGFPLAALVRHRLGFRWTWTMVIAIVAIALQWLPVPLYGIGALENIVKDQLIQLNATAQAEDRLVVIDIDEASLASIAPWPWKRSTIADLVEALVSDYQVRGVGLDVVFPATADGLGDQRLAALAQVAPVTFAQAFDFVPREPGIQTGLPVLQSFPSSLAAASVQWPVATGFIANHAGLGDARCVGNIGIRPDIDGQVRSVPLFTRWQQGYSPLLPWAMLQCQHSELGAKAPSDPGMTLPSALSQPHWDVPYTRSWKAYTVISAQDILQRDVDPQSIKGRWALVGSSALGLNDRATTPLGAAVAGVMVHAAVLTALLDHQAGQPPAPAFSFLGKAIAAGWILFSLALSAWVLGRWRAWTLLPLIAVCTLAWLVIAAGLMRQQLGFSVISPLLAYIVLFLLIPLEWWLTQRDEVRLLRTFANYVAPSVLRQMLRQGIDQPLVPRYCDITVLSADMQNYTGLTTIGSLEDAAQLTREFLQCLTDPLLSQQGTLDKYTGDGLVAFWGAPIAMHNHADKALVAAVQMVERVHTWNLQRREQGKPMARVRIGIESGNALVGDLGTRFRSTYTAVGDCINSASKLQNAAKQYNHDIIVGDQAAPRVTLFELAEIGVIALSGHSQPLPIFSPLNVGRSVPAEHADTPTGARPATV